MEDDRFCNGQVYVSITLFQHKSIHLQMWRSPDGLSINQIGHVIIDLRHTTEITDVKSCIGADCDNNHYTEKVK
jgi:hypothetical protein